MILTPYEFEKMPKLHQKDDFLRIKGNILYKEISYLTSDPLFISYLSTLYIPGVILPTDLIYLPDKSLFGYTMPFIPDGIDINEYIKYAEYYEIDVVKTILTILQTLEEIHKHFILSDIHNSNFLLTQKCPYIIDCDNGICFESQPKDNSVLYNIRIDGQEVYTSFLSDRLKTLISVLCIYYRFNFENIIFNYDIDYILKKLIERDPTSPFIKYFDYLLEQALKGNYDNINSFDKYIKSLCPPSENTLKRFR